MPRVGTSKEEQTSGGLFEFAEGRGEIIAAKVVNHAIPGFTPSCGFLLTIQRLDGNWQPMQSVEPVEEFLGAGRTATDSGDVRFHPGNAASSDDRNPELEIGGALDCGGEDGAEGTCILSATGRGPDAQARLSIFSSSCQDHGVKKELFNGFAGNLVGMQAHFGRMMLKKAEGSKKEQNPTCLIVGKGGQVAGGEVHRMPYAQTGTTSAPAATTTATNVKPISATNGAPPPPTTSAPAPTPTPTPTSVPVSAPVSGDLAERAAATAQSLISKIAAENSGKTMAIKKIQTRLPIMMAKEGITDGGMLKAVGAQAKNEEWFGELAEALGWTVAGGDVTFPAA